jgi:glycosyltransferase involved in cell wall biosynthesis
VFLEAAAQLLRERPRAAVRFYIVGGPIYRTRGSQFSSAELRASIDHLGLAGQVGLIDFQKDPAPIYRGLDVVVHASTQPEPFGLTIAEAMACGKAVVVSACGGAQELFAHERDALGYPPGDAAALAAAIKWLTDDADLRRRLGTAARNTAHAFPNRRMLELLHRVAGVEQPDRDSGDITSADAESARVVSSR